MIYFKTTRSYIEGLANALAIENHIVFKEGKVWKTDIKHKVIEYNMRDLEGKDPYTVKGLILHEVSHLNYTAETPPTQLLKDHPNMQWVYNALEDIRIEEKTKKQYGDFAKSGFAAVSSDAMFAHANELYAGKKIPPLAQFLFAMLGRNALLSEYHYFFHPSYLNYDYNDFIRMMDEEASVPFNKLLTVIYTRIRNAKDTAEIIEIADKDIYPLIKDILDDPNMNMMSAPCPSMSSLVKNEGEGEESYGDPVAPNPHATRWGDETRLPRKLEDLPSDRELEMMFGAYASTLAGRMRDILKEKTTIRYTGAYKRGKLLSKNSYKVLTDEKRLFSRRNTPRDPKYTFTLLLDESGSMGTTEDERLANSYMGAFLVKMVANKLKFKLNLIAYDHNCRILKDLSQYREARGGDNAESKALRRVLTVTDPADDNIVFLFTDGGFCENEETLRSAIDELVEKNYIVIGVGIGLKSWDLERLKIGYPVYINAEKVENLPFEVVKLLKGLIKR